MPNSELGQLSYEQLQEKAGKASSKEQVSDLKNEAEERDKTPTHEELVSIYESAQQAQKLEVSKSLVEGAYDRLGLENLGQAQFLNNHAIESLTNLPREDGPEIFFTKVKKAEMGWGRLRRKKGEVASQTRGDTDEVVVIVRFNNGGPSGSPEEQTMAIAVVKQIDGVPQFDKGPGLYRMLNEEEFQKQVKPGTRKNPSSRGGALYKGKMTIAQYHADYKEIEGKTLKQRWTKHDKAIVKTPGYWNINSPTGKETRKELMSRIEGEYLKVLDTLQQRNDKIIEEVERAREERNRRARERYAKEKKIEEQAELEQKQQQEFLDQLEFMGKYMKLLEQAKTTNDTKFIAMFASNSHFGTEAAKFAKLAEKIA